MCGIAGIFEPGGRVRAEEILRMTQVLRHRGPDDEGFLLASSATGQATPWGGDDTPREVYGADYPYAPREHLLKAPGGTWDLAFGHRRLSIIDLSPGGHQPMADSTGSYWIAYNGEVYNYIEVRRELESLGHRFRTGSDTEVILEGYKEWGPGCLGRFNGMWAFCIWDKPNRRLFCARDRFGVKPFYYFADGRRFAFASEIKGLLRLGFPAEADEGMVWDYLRFGLLEHGKGCCFKGVRKLPAGHFLELEYDGTLKEARYWDLHISGAFRGGAPEKEQFEAFRAVLDDSVAVRLRSDVPVGSCLSGGLDSSAIVCLASQRFALQEKGPGFRMETFSSCFEDPRYDEREYADEVVRTAGAEKNRIFPSGESLRDDLDALLWHQEEPFSGPGVYAQWEVFRAAKAKGVIVMLDGQGSDEQLAGYRKFLVFYLMELWRHRYLARFGQEALYYLISPDMLRTTSLSSGLRYFGSKLGILDPGRNLWASLKGNDARTPTDLGLGGGLMDRFYSDLFVFSLPALLRYEDRNSMAHSVESRLPFLDYRVAEFIAGLPYEQKIRRGWTKYILRQAMVGVLPEKIRLRKSKLGFSTPEDEWMRGPLSALASDAFCRPKFLDRFADLSTLKESFARFLTGRSLVSSKVFFRFMMLELWGRKFFAG